MDENVKVKFGAETGEIKGDVNALHADFKSLFEGITKEVKQMSDVVQSEMRQASSAMEKTEKDGRQLGNTFSSIKGKLGGLFAGFSLAIVGREIVNTTVEFERLRSILVTLEGDSANLRFDSLKEFAAQTPYDLAQVVKAFSFLKSQGLDPGNEALTSYGNTAAAMGKSLDDMVQAVGDAAVGEMERLKEFGVLARQQGDQVTFMFQGVSTTVARNSTEIQKYLRGLGDVQFAGAMERQAATLGGAFSNLGDAVAVSADRVGQAGLSSALSEIARTLSDSAAESGGFADALGAGLGTAITMVWDILQGFGAAVGDIMSAIASAISALTGSTKSDTETMKDLWYGLLLLINGFGVGVRVVMLAVGGVVKSASDMWVSFSQVVGRALQFDFSGSIAAFRAWGNNQVQIARETASGITAALREGRARQDEILGRRSGKGQAKSGTLPGYTPAPAPSVGGGGGVRSGAGSSGGSQGANQMSQWRDQLQQRIQDEVGFFKDSSRLELDFWQAKLGTVRSGTREEVQIRQQVFQLEKKMAQDGLRDQLTALDNRQSLARDDLSAQITIQDQKIEMLRRAYGEDSREYRAAAQERLQIEREISEHLVALAIERIDVLEQIERGSSDTALELARIEIDAERDRLQTMQELGQISGSQRLAREQSLRQEELTQEIAHESALYQIQSNALRARLALDDLRPAERRRVLADLELAEAEFQNRLTILNTRAAKDIERSQQEAALATKERWSNVLSPIGSAFDGFLSSMVTRSQSFEGALLAMGDSILTSFTSMGVQMLQNWVMNELAKTAATTAGTATRTTAETTAAAIGSTTSAAAGMAQITTNAAVGASGAFAATAPIPFVGPAMAPGAAGIALAAILGFGGMIASASGGFDIGSGQNPLTQLHEEEMVLPANLANPLREQLRGSGVMGSSLPSIAMAGANSTKSEMNSSKGGDQSFKYSPNINSGDVGFDKLLKKDGNRMRRWFRNEMRNSASWTNR